MALPERAGRWRALATLVALKALVALAALTVWALAPHLGAQQPPDGEAQLAQAQERWPFANAEQKRLFEQLLEELACPSCLGSSLAESPAPVAEDIRRTIYRQVLQGKSATEIRQWMVTRYGVGVSTLPESSAGGLWLWLLPPLLMLLAALMLYRTLRQR